MNHNFKKKLIRNSDLSTGASLERDCGSAALSCRRSSDSNCWCRDCLLRSCSLQIRYASSVVPSTLQRGTRRRLLCLLEHCRALVYYFKYNRKSRRHFVFFFDPGLPAPLQDGCDSLQLGIGLDFLHFPLIDDVSIYRKSIYRFPPFSIYR